MSKEPSKLRFDHREVAVVFSLFVFVSLLMFTVGILVGKGLAQARYETLLVREGDKLRTGSLNSHSAAESHDSSGESDPHLEVAPNAAETSPAPIEADAKGENTHEGHAKNEKGAEGSTEKTLAKADEASPAKPAEPLKLIPKKQENPDVREALTDAGKMNAEASHILKNPKLKGIFEGEESGKRSMASAPVKPSESKPSEKSVAKVASKTPAKESSTKGPAPASLAVESAAQGKFTVQVGSYTAEKDAAERVQALKALGFPHAYFSAKELGEKREIFYRVWLGYFSDPQKAEQSGQQLKDKGEVKNYIVRKTDGGN